MIADDAFRLECRECKQTISSSQLGESVYVDVKRKQRDDSYRAYRFGPFHAECGKVFNERMRAQEVSGEVP